MNPYKNITLYFWICLLSVVGLIINRIYLGNFGFRFDPLDLFLSTLFIIFCITSFFFFLLENKIKNQIPFFPLIIFYLFICYGFSFELINESLLTMEKDALTKTLLIINLAIVFFNIGYFSFKNIFKYKLLKFEYKNYNYLIIFSLFFFTIIVLNKFINFIPNNLNQIIIPITSTCCSILFYKIIYDNRKRNLFLLLPIVILIFFETLKSSYVYPAMLSLQYIVIYFIIKKKVPIIEFFLIFLIFFFLHSFKGEYRKELILDNNYVDITKRIKVFGNLHLNKIYTLQENELPIKIYTLHENEPTKKDIKSYNSWRIAHSFSSLYTLANKTPEEIGYLNGETYSILIAKLIPRIFWANKPNDDLANRIGRKYGVLNEKDYGTSWNLPIINEAYINFGYSGVIFIMVILGLLVRSFTNFFSNKSFKSLESHIGIYVCCSTFFWESHLSLTYGGIYYPILFLYVSSISYYLLLKIFNKV